MKCHLKKDGHNRWRNITVGSRVSLEENELIKKPLHCRYFKNRIQLPKMYEQRCHCSGQSKSVQSAEKRRAEILSELKRINKADEVSDELLEIIELVSVTLIGLKGESENE